MGDKANRNVIAKYKQAISFIVCLKALTLVSEHEGCMRHQTCKPNSVTALLPSTVIPLGRSSLNGSSDLPGSITERAAPPPLFGLAPHGVCPASDITAAAVRSYRTISPLPVYGFPQTGGIFSVALSVESA